MLDRSEQDYVVYRSGNSLRQMPREAYERWEQKVKKAFPSEWSAIEAQYPLLAQGLTRAQAVQFCRLVDEGYGEFEQGDDDVGTDTR